MGRILNADALTDHGLIEGRRLVLDLLEYGLRAADPYYATRAVLQLDGPILTIGQDIHVPPGSPLSGPAVIDLRQVRRVVVLGAGKGIQRAALAIEETLAGYEVVGEVIDKHGTPHCLNRVHVTFGAHPVPDEGCVEGCRRILAMTETLTADDLVITLMGNGIGSLLTLPAPGVTLDDIRRIVYTFQIDRGGPTVELIPIRNHLDTIKGGKFTRALSPARVVHLIAFYRPPSYDDMVRHPLFRWLHSLPDETTYADAIRSLKRWDMWEETPPNVRTYLERGDPTHETMSVAEFEKRQERVFFIFPRERGMVYTAKRRAEELGLRAHVLFDNYTLKPEAAQVGMLVANLALHSELNGDPFQPPCVLISSGELIVTVGKETGMGGRNQEYAVAAAIELAHTQQVVMGSVDSDGTDGPGRQFLDDNGYHAIPVLTGGLVDAGTLPRSIAQGIDLRDALKRHDTSPSLYHLDDGIIATAGMSMGDLCITFIPALRGPAD